ncbi:MAG: hypothetical protein IKR25_00760 [Muribaculaceae bacterium]|nr:hypothetical protein [Muribaculaceae bacterium]
MTRRDVSHDYTSRCFYMITLTVLGRHPVLGQVDGTSLAPCMKPSLLGAAVQREWGSISTHCSQVAVVACQLMPDHLHGILYVREPVNFPLGNVVKGFKLACNRVLRELLAAMKSPLTEKEQALLHLAALRQPGKAVLWSEGYNDIILRSYDELETWKQYLLDNPRRLLLRREHSEWLRPFFDLPLGQHKCCGIGNRDLLDAPVRVQVHISRSMPQEQINRERESLLEQARAGAVLVSPSVSPGEKQVMRAAFEAGMRLIVIQENGFTPLSKPHRQFFEACAQGRLLLLSLWRHHNEKRPLTAAKCAAMNQPAKYAINKAKARVAFYPQALPRKRRFHRRPGASPPQCIIRSLFRRRR